MKGALQQLVYRQKIEDIEYVKQVLNSCWDMISQELKCGPANFVPFFWTTL